MTTHRIRWLWFVGLWLLAPWPWPLPAVADVFVPAARYALLASAAIAIVVAEGAAGPVALVVAVFTGWALVTTLGCWLVAWLGSRALALVSPRIRTAIFFKKKVL